MSSKSVFFYYLKENNKRFFVLIVIFLFGIIGGIAFINNVNENQMQEIICYVNSLKDNIKNYDNINKTAILIQSLKQNLFFVSLIWFLGCTLLGSFLINIAIFYKGFSIGYTASAIIAAMGIKHGSVFFIISLLLQNLIYIPALIVLAESGIRLFKNLKNKQYVNIKSEILRHTVIMFIVAVISIIASFIEVYISTNFLIFLKDFF